MGRRNGDNQQSLSLSDIKEGSILQIWYSDKDKETISQIGIMQGMPGAAGNNPQNPPPDNQNSSVK